MADDDRQEGTRADDPSRKPVIGDPLENKGETDADDKSPYILDP